MKYFLLALALFVNNLFAQQGTLKPVIINAATPVKNQGNTGTCWNYSTTSLLESQLLQKNGAQIDISEMYTVRCVYLEKAKNYIHRLGKTQFGEGGLAHDLINAVDKYGAMPQEVFPGGNQVPDHAGLEFVLKNYLDSILKKIPLSDNWLDGFTKILDVRFGVPPQNFIYKNKTYKAVSFAKDVLRFNAKDYISLTSFTDHPYYQSFVLQVPDNFSSGSFYNVPIDELINITKDVLKNKYTVTWDADVTNNGFKQAQGFAVFADSVSGLEKEYSPQLRQQLYENLITQDDHLMQIIGLDQDDNGKIYFKVKNSWGEVGPLKGYIEVSETYFAMNTISILIPRSSLPRKLLKKFR